jgi:phosphate/sulfate permease
MTVLYVLYILGGVLGYSIFSGLIWYLLHECTDWDTDFPIIAGIFWPLLLPAILGNYFAIFIFYCLDKIKEYKKIPQIYIKEGAKINTSAEYENLKRLVTDFEVKNRSDSSLEDE